MLECTLCKARVKVNINFTLVSIFSALPEMSQKRLDDSNSAQLEVYCAHVQLHLLSPPLLFTSKPRVSLEHYLAHVTSYLLP